MTAEQYAHKHYGQFVNYKAVSKQSFQDGLTQGREETKTDEIVKMEKKISDLTREVIELREYKKDKEDLFYDSERLGEFLAGL